MISSVTKREPSTGAIRSQEELSKLHGFWPEIVPFYNTVKYNPYGASSLQIPEFHLESIVKATQNVNSLDFQYVVPLGRDDLRESIVKHFPELLKYEKAGICITKENIGVFGGAVVGIHTIIETICQPGDEIICFEPVYPCYLERPALRGIQIRTIRHNFNPKLNQFELDLESIKQTLSLSKKIKAIIICNPDNPNTRVWTKEDYLGLSEVLNAHPEVLVIEDMAYWLYHNDGCDTIPFATVSKGNFERSVAFYSAGKMYDVTGLRLGIAVGSPKFIEDLATRALKCMEFVSSFDQLIIRDDIPLANEPFMNESSFYESRRKIIIANAKLIEKEFVSLGVKVIQPQGSYYIILNVDYFRYKLKKIYHQHLETGEHHEELDQAFCRMLLKEKNVGMMPFSCLHFGDDKPDAFVRVAINRNMDEINYLISSFKEVLTSQELN